MIAPAAPAQQARPLEMLVERREALRQSQAGQLMDLEQRIAAVASSDGSVGTSLQSLAAAMRRDSTRLALLEELNVKRIEGRFDLQTVRYQTGLEILRVMMRNAEKLDFSTSLATSLARFEDAANPLNSPAFRQQISSVGKSSDGGFKLPDLLLKNPIVSVAASLASLFTSSAKPKEKDEALAKISCVLDFTTKASRDASDARQQMASIDGRLRAFLRDGDATLVGYTATVGAERGWARLKQESASTVRSPVNDAVDRYFATRREAALTRPWSIGIQDELVETNYQIDQVRAMLTRYEDLLAEMESFLSRYAATAARYRDQSCAAIPNLTATLAAIEEQAEANRGKFRAAWLGDIPAKSRAALFTVP
ncbi:MAG: hypothetical protein R2909_13785 [Gemmatimonadales bacterium]